MDPTVNMWELAQPLIERWVRQHRSPQARLKTAALEGLETLHRLPKLVTDLQLLVEDMRANKALGNPTGCTNRSGDQERPPWKGICWLLAAALALALLS